jgi:hypothetical protein
MGRRGQRFCRGVFCVIGVVGLVAGAVLLPVDASAAPSTWSITSTTNRGSYGSVLLGLSCADATNCQAVGWSFNSSGYQQTLVESWNGSAWSVVASPNKGRVSNSLQSVSCSSPSSCVAVGYRESRKGDSTLIESWDGTTWSIIHSPNQGTTEDQEDILNGVSCASTTSCVAVGDYYTGTTGLWQTLVESWNGTAWSIIPSPNLGTNDNHLRGVSCVSSTSCMAVGTYYASGEDQTLAESWDGASWSAVPTIDPSSFGNALGGVDCTSADICTAVGGSATGSESQTLVESWDGTNWSVVSSPNQAGGSGLSDVSCDSSSSCVAVGGNGTGKLSTTLIESWDGTTWSITPSPNPAGKDIGLSRVSCPTSTDCLAIGTAWMHKTFQTLAESGSTPLEG